MDTINTRINKVMCCGCMACEKICAFGAISSTTDEMGFTYPIVDIDKCTRCGECDRVCAFSDVKLEKKIIDVLCVTHIDPHVVEESRSGGIFTAISDYILEKGGSVYGASIDEEFIVEHKRAVTKAERNAFRKSKYVQSNIIEIYDEIADDLKSGKKVLFSGTPCQCDAIIHYLTLSRVCQENFYTCDIVCHSIASPELFARYLEYQALKAGDVIKSYDFRDKETFAWPQHVEKIIFKNKGILFTDEYTKLFFDYDIRPSCFNCKYASISRVSDITIGDCWGAEKKYPEISLKGASLVLINSEKGKGLLNNVKKQIRCRDIDISEVMQRSLIKPVEKNEDYDLFWEDYKRLDIMEVISKYSYNSLAEFHEVISDDFYNYTDEIVIWGSGNCFQTHIEEVCAKNRVSYVCDNNPTKWGKKIYKNIICIEPDELKAMDNPCVVIMVDDIKTAFKIARQLIDMKIYKFDIFYNWIEKVN